MEDIYDDSTGLSDYADGVVGGVILGKFMSDQDPSTYEPGVDSEGRHIDHTSEWEAIHKRGSQGIIAFIAHIVFYVTAVASIIMLIVLGFIHGFNF